MRVVAAALALTLWAVGQAAAQAPGPAISPEEAHAGCYHTDLRACMISLGSVFWFPMDEVAAQIAKRNELDVNGRTAHRQIFIDAEVPHNPAMIGMTLTLASPAPNDEVVKISMHLPADPNLAHTASEYDRTLLYDVVSVVLGNHCPNLDRLTLYRFFENDIKPKEKTKTQVVRQEGTSDVSRETTDTGPVPFCGAMFSLLREAEWYGPTEVPGRILLKSRALWSLTIE